MTFICTKNNPWREGLPTPVTHTVVVEIEGSQRDGWPSGDTVRKRCMHCGKEWTEELPQ